jgi:hypothetical protein
VVGWTESTVILNNPGILLCTDEPELYVRDLAAGEHLYQVIDDGEPLLARRGYWLHDGRMLLLSMVTVGRSTASVSVADFDMRTVEDIAETEWDIFVVSDDGRYAAFCSDEAYKVTLLNLETFERETVAEGCPVYYGDLVWRGDTLIYLDVDRNLHDKTLELTEITYTPGAARTERVIYTGALPGQWKKSPYNETLAAQIEPEDESAYWLVWYGDNVIFDSRQEDRFDLFSLSPQPWSSDGTWLHLDAHQTEDQALVTVSINLQTGEVIAAPRPGFIYVNESPDGAWWLYWGPIDYNDMAPTTVLAYHVETGEVITLVETEQPLEVPWWQWPTPQSFIWSPIVE